MDRVGLFPLPESLLVHKVGAQLLRYLLRVGDAAGLDLGRIQNGVAAAKLGVGQPVGEAPHADPYALQDAVAGELYAEVQLPTSPSL